MGVVKKVDIGFRPPYKTRQDKQDITFLSLCTFIYIMKTIGIKIKLMKVQVTGIYYTLKTIFNI